MNGLNEMVKHRPTSLLRVIADFHFDSHKPVHFQCVIIVGRLLLALKLDSLLVTKLLTIFLFLEFFNFGIDTCFDVCFMNKLKQKENQNVHVRLFLDN
jgi:hypothetical protein